MEKGRGALARRGGGLPRGWGMASDRSMAPGPGRRDVCFAARPSLIGTLIVLLLAFADPSVAAAQSGALGGDDREGAPTRESEVRALVKEQALSVLGLRSCTVHRIGTPGAAARAAREPVELVLPIDGEERIADLRPSSVRSEDFVVFLSRADGRLEPIPPAPARTYRGTVRGLDGAQIAATIDSDGVTAMITMPDGRTKWIEPVWGRVNAADLDHHVAYESEDVVESGGTCVALAAPAIGFEPDDGPPGGGFITDCGGEICVAEVAIDADHKYFQAYGTPEAVQTRIESILDAVNLQYEQDVRIRHVLTTIIIREHPIYNTIVSDELLMQFRRHWEQNHTDIRRDVAHLFTGKEIEGNVIGIAWLNAICEDRGYGLSQSDCCGTFAAATDLTAHELGHNWSADHCSCAGWTMNPFITVANRFHSLHTVPEIKAYLRTRTCLHGASFRNSEIPIADSFETGFFDLLLWEQFDGVQINDLAINPPNGSLTCNIDGRERLVTIPINAQNHTNLQLKYWWQRAGLGDTPEPGDDLVVEYKGHGTDQWIEVNRHLGSGGVMEGFSHAIVDLPQDAEHIALRVRFRGTATTHGGEGTGFDDWFVDLVTITGEPALPGPFTLESPVNRQTGVAIPVTLRWSRSNRAIDYRLQIASDPFFSNIITTATVSDTQFTATSGEIIPDRRYYWRVHARNQHGETRSSGAIPSFVTVVNQPGPFDLLEPEEGAIVRTSRPTLRWTPSEDASSYLIIVARDPDLLDRVVSHTKFADEGEEQSYRLPGLRLEPDTEYHWSVVGLNAAGDVTSTPSARSFVTGWTCAGDADGDGEVTTLDISFVIARLGQDGGPADLDADGFVGIPDITYVIVRLGTCQTP